MEYYYDKDNDFYVIELNGVFNQNEYMKVLKKILNEEKRGDLLVYYSTFTKDSKYVVIDFEKRKFTDEELSELLSNSKKVR